MSLSPFLAVLVAAALSAILWVVSSRKTSDWESRGFEGVKTSWTSIFAQSTGLALLSTLIAAFLGANFWQASAISLLGWMLVLVCYTDFATYKIPREPSIAAYYLGLPLLAGHALESQSWAPVAAFGVWMIIPTLFFLVAGGGIGMGDIRLFILFGTTVSWWIGIEYMIYALVAACVIQLLIFPIAKMLGRGQYAAKGSMEAPEPAADEVAQTATDAASDGMDDSSVGNSEKSPAPKKRMHLPFGPALMVVYFAVGMYSATRQLDTCDALVGMLCS